MIIPIEHRKRYQAAKDKYDAIAYPSATRDFGTLKANFPDTRTANGLTRFIINFLLWSGHFGESTKNMGTPRKKTFQKFNLLSGKLETVDNGIEWTKGAGTIGSSDIKGHIKNPNHKFPIPIYIEIKIRKDVQSKDQKLYEKQVNSTGALYCIVKTPEDFFTFYDYCLSL